MPGSGDYRLGPVGDIGKCALMNDRAMYDVKQKRRFGKVACFRIAFLAVVIHAKFRDLRQQTNQVQAAAIESSADRGFRDIVASTLHSSAYAFDMQFDGIETHVPNPDSETSR